MNHTGEFVEALALDKARARKVLNQMIGRTLTSHEVAGLLERMG